MTADRAFLAGICRIYIPALKRRGFTAYLINLPGYSDYKKKYSVDPFHLCGDDKINLS